MADITNPSTNDGEEEKIEKSLRPQSFDEMIGRTTEIQNLKIMIDAARKRGDSLDHMMFYGPPGLGKTSISNVIAKEMGVPIYVTSGPAIERQGDLASILTGVEDRGILFIDEIHRLNRVVEEMLYPAMEDRAIDIIIGKGPSAKTLRLELSKFTLIGATTRIGRLSAPLRDRFGATFRFDFYSNQEISEIIHQKSKIFNVPITQKSAELIAKRSRKTPRIAIRLLKRIRDFAEVEGSNEISEDIVNGAFEILDVDEFGLDYLDRKVLDCIINKFNSGPVGISTIAASISEDVDTIEDMCEPFLLQEGFIQRTPKGRIATEKSIKHITKLN